MKISNNPSAEKNNPFAELFRLQTEFQARLADETLRYLRRLQSAAVPASPGTIVIPEGLAELKARASAGAFADFELEVENLQRVYCTASPALSPLVSASGTTWFAESESIPVTLLVPPGATAALKLRVTVPAQLPHGVYRGCLMLHGFREGALPVSIEIGTVDDGATETARPAVQRKAKPAARRRRKS